MRFRIRAFATHLGASALTLSVILGALYVGWYKWPGWYLTGVASVVLVMVGVDVVVGPLLTLVIASPAKQRRLLARDVGVIILVQLIALLYGTVQLWNGRPLYLAFSENVLQLVQAYDIPADEAELGATENPTLAPRWYSLPRWIWAPLPPDEGERKKIVDAAMTGGTDVIGMPRFYKTWESGLPALKMQLKPMAAVTYFFPDQKKKLRERMLAAGLNPDQSNAITLTGRNKFLLAVFDPANLQLVALLHP